MLDNELLERAKNNDNSAIEILAQKYNPLISSIVRRYFLIGGDTEDLMQEAMIGFWNAINSYNEKETASFKTFLTLCVTRKLQSAVRSANSQKHKPLNECVSVDKTGSEDEGDEGYDMYFYLLPEQRSPEDVLIEEEQDKNIKTRMKEMLTEFQFKVLQMYLAGHTYLEIADKFNKSKKDIDNTLMTIKKVLSNLKNEDL